MPINRLLSRNIIDHDKVWWYIQSAEGTIQKTEPRVPSKAVLQEWRWDKDFPRKTKAEGVLPQTCLIGNTEVSSSS